MAQSTTQTLVDRLKLHDPTAVAELSDSYGAKIHQLAFRYLKNREDAEEVAQDVLLKVYQKIHAFRGDAALIHRITFNAAMSRLREFKQNLPERRDTAADEDTGRELRREVADWSPLADEDVLRGEMRQALVRALKEMPVLYRADHPARGVDDRRGKRRAAREGADAEVAAAPGAVDAPRSARGVCRRPVAAPGRHGLFVSSTVAVSGFPSRSTVTSILSPGLLSRRANVKS
jgi:RNA polymerase sigma-70 factor (ECF subfamily)